MILEEFIKKGKSLTKWWISIVIIKFSICFLLAIVTTYIKPTSNIWLIEFLSFIKGVPNEYNINAMTMVYIWTPINALLKIVDFYVSYSMIKSTLQFTQLRNSLVIKNIKKQLIYVAVLTMVAFWFQLINILLCWCLEIYVLFKRYSFVKYLYSLEKYSLYESNKSFLLRKLFHKNLNAFNSKNLEKIMEE